MDGEKKKGLHLLCSLADMTECFPKNIYQTFTPISTFSSYPEKVLRHELHVCERAHGEFII